MASYDAITEFMSQEEATRQKAKDGDGYICFRDRMTRVDDGKGGLVWVRTENVEKWRESLSAAAPSTSVLVFLGQNRAGQNATSRPHCRYSRRGCDRGAW